MLAAMKVAGNTQHALRGVFQKHQLGWNWSNLELDKWVRVLRKSLSHRPEGSDQEAKALREGFWLAAGQLVQFEKVETFSKEQWSELLWNVLEAATAQTQSFLRFPSS